MRRTISALIIAAIMLVMTAASAFATNHDGGGGGATFEEFVCFRFTPSGEITLGTGKVVTTPSGNVHVICTGKPLTAND
jgi:hypothetical protein